MKKILLIDKPAGWTSFDVVKKVRGIVKSEKEKRGVSLKTKVGHAGTLDPFATGLLIVLIDEYTKKQGDFAKLDKEYLATIRLGETSTTGDTEGEISKVKIAKDKAPTKKQIKEALLSFEGDIEQAPHKFSAVKINGERAYDLARKGVSFEIKKRTVRIYKIELLDYQYPELKIKILCSSGTYIRSLAEDIGSVLKTGAYLSSLRRTFIDRYRVVDAQKIDQISID